MSNVKTIDIRGEMPFYTNEHERLNRYLGVLNAPSFGLRITWGKQTMRDNGKGGQTAWYEFVIAGQEAVRWDWYHELVDTIEKFGGYVLRADCHDLEAG
jgi:hypothetical protein